MENFEKSLKSAVVNLTAQLAAQTAELAAANYWVRVLEGHLQRLYDMVENIESENDIIIEIADIQTALAQKGSEDGLV